MGQLPLDQVVERMRNKNRDCQHNKTSYRRPALAKPTSVLRVLKTLHSSRTSKPVVSTLKIAGLNVCVQILRWQVERPFWKCGFYQLFITIHSARQIQSETALRMSEQKEYPTGLSLLCVIL